ncbi:MAG: NAD(P)-binding domain-containing protein [Nocardioides sp.]|uniref:NAD(P)-dependent oxidoreductase n=1 Tax=Nocardioides sp. TaxID=35761 RepID=UPI0039E4DEEF
MTTGERAARAPRIGFVGPGRMGRPMVDRLVDAGRDVRVHARSEERRSELEAAGIAVADDIAGLAAGCDVVLVTVFDDDQLRAVADIVAASMPDGGVLVSHVTGRVRTVDELAARHPRIGVVAAPVSGTPADIAAARLTVMLGGEEADRSRARAVVSTYADPVIEAGSRRAALSVKLLNNLLLAANVQCLLDAARLAGSLGLGEDVLLTSLAQMSGGSRASEHALRYGGTDELVEGIAQFLVKDVAVCFEQAEELGVDTGLLGDLITRGGRFV